MLVDGQVVRWCQQCCCFHELSAFDDDKRCCLQLSVRLVNTMSRRLQKDTFASMFVHLRSSRRACVKYSRCCSAL